MSVDMVFNWRGGLSDAMQVETIQRPLSVYDSMPVILPHSLDDLQGPMEGVVTLPSHLDWSPVRTYDCSDRMRVRTLYRTVLREAATVNDSTTWVNRRRLCSVWSDLILPDRVREAWELAYPELAGC